MLPAIVSISVDRPTLNFTIAAISQSSDNTGSWDKGVNGGYDTAGSNTYPGTPDQQGNLIDPIVEPIDPIALPDWAQEALKQYFDQLKQQKVSQPREYIEPERAPKWRRIERPVSEDHD